MKLIIDIPEEVWLAINRSGLLRISEKMQRSADRAIQFGTPIPDNATVCDIEQIRAEIEQFVSVSISDVEVIPKNDVIQIINKYKGE